MLPRAAACEGDANGPLSRVIAYKSLFYASDFRGAQAVSDGNDVEQERTRRKTVTRRKRSKKSMKEEEKRGEREEKKIEEATRAGEQCGLIQRKISAGSQLRTHVEGLLLLSRLANVPRLEIGHLPDEIEDLHRWFAGYYRRSV